MGRRRVDHRKIWSHALRAYAETKGLTPEELSGLLHCSNRSLRRWLAATHAPPRKSLPGLCAVLGLSVDDLFLPEELLEAQLDRQFLSLPALNQRYLWSLERDRFRSQAILGLAAVLTMLQLTELKIPADLTINHDLQIRLQVPGPVTVFLNFSGNRTDGMVFQLSKHGHQAASKWTPLTEATVTIASGRIRKLQAIDHD